MNPKNTRHAHVFSAQPSAQVLEPLRLPARPTLPTPTPYPSLLSAHSCVMWLSVFHDEAPMYTHHSSVKSAAVARAGAFGPPSSPP